jgi:two-component system phosphate regulon sensor histidine kinase PhoR
VLAIVLSVAPERPDQALPESSVQAPPQENLMSKRLALFVGGALIVLAPLVLMEYFVVRAILAALILILAAVFISKTLSQKDTDVDDHSLVTSRAPNRAAAQRFAFSKLFEATMSGMREGLLVVDKEMRVVASNPAAHRLFKWNRTRLNGQRLTELTRNPAIYSAFLDALKGTERSGVKIHTSGLERLAFDLRVVPLGGDNGSPAEGALGVFIDVTRIDRLEQIRQEFLSNVSHELRTPLTAILAFVETLESGAIEDQEASRRFLPIIRKNANRMHDLIDDILELSAIEAGTVQVKAEAVELNPIVNDVVASLASRAEAKEVVVSNDVEPGTMVYADARRLEQMLTNLIDNGIKFNRKDGRVSVSYLGTGAEEVVTNGHEPKQRMDKIVVADTGEGIPGQHLERLFERFYRVDRARSREMGGTGLGLAIVKHLARAHGGEIRVTSELGTGSVFTIELPADPLV